MKIAHVNYRPSDGVFKKIIGQAKAAGELGFEIDFIVISDKPIGEGHRVRFAPIDLPNNPLKRKIENIFFRYKYIRKSIDYGLYDKIILRYPGVYDLTSKKYYSEYGHKVITEHHSMLVDEMKSLDRGLTLPVRILFERRNFKPCLSQVAGIIANTDELRRKVLETSDPGKSSVEVSNGVDVRGTRFSGFKAFDNRSLNIIFLSQKFYPWVGLDRLLKGLNSYEGAVKIDLFLIGTVIRETDFEWIEKLYGKKNVNVHMIGEVYGERLEDYFESVNIAVSSLAVFRKKQNQDCTLKTREYLARGIPFIYAYDDVDLEEDNVFSLKLAEDDAPVDINRIIDFAERTGKSLDISEQMRTYAEKHVDWKIKIQEMHNFVTSIK